MGSYLKGMKECGLSAKEKREKQCNRELKKSASQTRSIVDMFSAHCDKNQFHDKHVTYDAASVATPLKTLKERRLQKVKTLFEK